ILRILRRDAVDDRHAVARRARAAVAGAWARTGGWTGGGHDGRAEGLGRRPRTGRLAVARARVPVVQQVGGEIGIRRESGLTTLFAHYPGRDELAEPLIRRDLKFVRERSYRGVAVGIIH